MGKSVGFIGNFKGKLGNTVGYKVSQSNSGTNQGVRVYQPNIKNPKSAAQAEQRAKYAPIFATYRALKDIIDRGNQFKPYGNASRIAWLKSAFRAHGMAWYVKGAEIECPVICPISFGTIQNLNYWPTEDDLVIETPKNTGSAQITSTVTLSEILLDNYPWLKEGDQVTIVGTSIYDGCLVKRVFSFIIDTTVGETVNGFSLAQGYIHYDYIGADEPVVIIISREGANGEHLRSASSLKLIPAQQSAGVYSNDSKQAAIASYMATAGANADWAEESIQ